MELTSLPILTALGHPTRWRTFELLLGKSGGMAPTQIAAALGTYPNLMSTHLRIMREAGLVSSERSGREILYRVTPAAARTAAEGMLKAINGSEDLG